MTAEDFLSINPQADRELVEKAIGFYTEKRLRHVLGCTGEACRLAEHYGLDINMAFTAAVLHDITKKLPFDRQLQLCEKYDIVDKAFLQDAPAVLHAFTGAELAKEEFSVSTEVADAIRWHSSGRAGMTGLEKLVYLADIIEPGRDFKGVERLRAEAYVSMDRAMLSALMGTIEHVRQNGEGLFYRSVEALDYFEKLI